MYSLRPKKLVPQTVQMDVSSTNLILDTSICGTDFLLTKELHVIHLCTWWRGQRAVTLLLERATQRRLVSRCSREENH